jgi:hypothetical protein
VNRFDLENVSFFNLRKQHLTTDATSRDITTIVWNISGLHATASTVPYLSLFARCPNFKKPHLEQELYQNMRLAKIRCVRKTIYIQAKEMLPIMHAATVALVEKASRRFMEARGVTLHEYERVSKDILGLLSEKEMTAAEIKEALHPPLEISSVLYFMCDQGILIRGKPEKGWKDKNQRYGLFADYFPDLNLVQYDEKEAVCLLVERYLDSFGPATESDIRWWTGLGKMKIRQALEQLRTNIVDVFIAGLEGRHLLLRSDIEPLSASYTPKEPMIRLLPSLDPYLMGYKYRGRYLNPQYNAMVFDRSGNATSTIMINGRVAGVWDFDEREMPTIKLHFFSSPSPDILVGVRQEAVRLGAFIAEKEVRIKECDSMTPLIERPAGGFMSPLKHG